MHAVVIGLLLVGVLCSFAAAGLVKLTGQKPEVANNSRLQRGRRPVLGETALYLPNTSLLGGIGEETAFELPGGQLSMGVIKSIVNFGADHFVLSGSVEFDGSFHLSYSAGVVIGEVSFPNDGIKYQLRPKDLSMNLYTMKAVPRSVYDRDDSPEDTDPELQATAREAATHRKQLILLQQQGQQTDSPSSDNDGGDTEAGGFTPDGADSGPVLDTNNILDVMFIFTPQALASVGGSQSSMEALAALSVQLANEAYANSQLPIRMRCVSVAAVADTTYLERGFTIELERLHIDRDGHFDAEVNARSVVGADAVVLFVADTSYCGLAYSWATADMAFSVVSTQCPHSVAHEVGHNIGCDHDRFTAHNYDYSHYNFGYCWDTSAKTCSRSVMAYAGCVTPGKRTNCPRVSYFSSVAVTQGSQHHTTGIATSDNARVIREQLSRAISWRRSKVPGGLITSAQPSAIAVGRCQTVVVKGFRIGTLYSNITSVTLNGVPAQKILSQSLDEVEVLAGLSDVPGTGDIVVTTSSGYQTTLAGAFTYEATSGSFLTDFDTGLGTMWTSTGAADWSVLRYCNSLPCSAAPISGPLVGVGGSGNFLKIQSFEANDNAAAALTATFNQDGAGGCEEAVTSLSLYYHLWGPHSDLCGGSLVVTMQTVGSSAWTTILTATEVQAHQDDPWLPLEYTFPNPTAVAAIRITAVPYSGQATCYYWGSVSVDEISVTKTTTCSKDNCDFVSAAPTLALTSSPTPEPTTHQPTTARPSTVQPSVVVYTPSPTSMVSVLEIVRFDCTQVITGVTVQQFLADPADLAGFVATVASTLLLGPDGVCCATMLDLHDRSTGSPDDRSISVTYTVKLQLQYEVSIVGERNVSDIHRGGDHSVSEVAAGRVYSAQQMLTDSVSSGAFLTALKQVLSAGVISAGLGVAPVSASSFSAPISEVRAAPEDVVLDSGGPLPVVQQALFLGVALIVLAFGIWGCVRWSQRPKPPPANSSEKPENGSDSPESSPPRPAESYRVLKTFSVDDGVGDHSPTPGIELTELESSSGSSYDSDPGAGAGAGVDRRAGALHVEESTRSRSGSFSVPRKSQLYRTYSTESAGSPSLEPVGVQGASLSAGAQQEPGQGQKGPGVVARTLYKTRSGSGVVFAPELSVSIGDVSARYLQPAKSALSPRCMWPAAAHYGAASPASAHTSASTASVSTVPHRYGPQYTSPRTPYGQGDVYPRTPPRAVYPQRRMPTYAEQQAHQQAHQQARQQGQQLAYEQARRREFMNLASISEDALCQEQDYLPPMSDDPTDIAAGPYAYCRSSSADTYVYPYSSDNNARYFRGVQPQLSRNGDAYSPSLYAHSIPPAATPPHFLTHNNGQNHRHSEDQRQRQQLAVSTEGKGPNRIASVGADDTHHGDGAVP